MSAPLFGELRSVLQRPASEETWGALCAQLDLWPVAALEAVALPYALGHLARWPDALSCEAPRAWTNALLAGRPCPQLRCARSIFVTMFPGGIFPTPEQTARLDAPSMRGLRAMTLLPSTLDAPAFCAWFGGAQHLGALRTLMIVSEQLDDAQLEVLAREPALARLTSLALRQGYRITARGARALADSPHLADLTSLDLFYARLGDEGALALASSPHLARLTSLSLIACGVGPAGAQALASSPSLTSLLLGHNPLGLQGARALLEGSAPLSTLDLRACRLPLDALEELAEQGRARGITALDLSHNPSPPPTPTERMYL
jgi:hypothetical protein